MSKKLDEKMRKINWTTKEAFRDKDSLMMCRHCHKRLGFWRMLRKSLRVKEGYHYIVICKSCGHPNNITKGELGKQMDQNWKKHGV